MNDDLISRQALIEAIKAEREWLNFNVNGAQHHYHMMHETARIISIVWNLPTVNLKQKTGRWSKQMLFNDGYGGKKVGYICSACRKYVPFKGNYCGNCGAKMESEECQ